MDAQSLQQAVQQVGAAALAISFVAGLFFSVNLVALAAIPVSMAYVTKARSTRQALWFGAVFIAGMVLAHVVLGGAAGLAGLGVQALLGRHWGLVLGPWLLLMGLLWPGWVRLPFKGLPLRARRATTVRGSLALGALGWIEQQPSLAHYRRGFDVAGGVTLVLMGLYMINAYFFFVRSLAA